MTKDNFFQTEYLAHRLLPFYLIGFNTPKGFVPFGVMPTRSKDNYELVRNTGQEVQIPEGFELNGDGSLVINSHWQDRRVGTEIFYDSKHPQDIKPTAQDPGLKFAPQVFYRARK